jgi:hypothetical protein
MFPPYTRMPATANKPRVSTNDIDDEAGNVIETRKHKGDFCEP